MMQLRRLALLPVLFIALACHAQQLPQQPSQSQAGSEWRLVQALPAGSFLKVKAHSRSANCILQSVDAETLTCRTAKNPVFQRADIVSIKLARRGHAVLIGTAIGVGLGAAVGQGLSDCPANGCTAGSKTAGAVEIGATFGGIGALIGWAISRHSQYTIYSAQ